MPNKLTNEVVSLIFNISQILREKARTRANSKDCSFLHMQTLHFIKEGKSTTMKELAAYLHITPPSATSLINSLVHRGLVERIFDKHDRRTIKLHISKIGAASLKKNLKGMAMLMGEEINKLTDNEKKAFIAILSKIAY